MITNIYSPNKMTSIEKLHLCLFKHNIPIELREIIVSYFVVRCHLTNNNIHEIVKLWVTL
jgi:hypothetical protein